MRNATAPSCARSTFRPSSCSSSIATSWFSSLSSTSSTSAPAIAAVSSASRRSPRLATSGQCWPSERITVSNSSDGLTGLASTASMPDCPASSASLSSPYAVISTSAGTCPRGRRWSSLAVAMPSSPGIRQSRKIRSYGRPAASASATDCSAAWPEATVSTAKVMLASISPTIWRA